MTQTPIDSALRQPPTTPNPIGIEAIGQRNPQAIENEVLPRPPLRHRAGGNRRRGVHENHHEKEKYQHRDITDGAVEEKALEADDAIGECSRSFSRRVHCCAKAPTVTEHRKARSKGCVPPRWNWPVPPVTPAYSEAINEERDATQGVDHQIHGRRV